MGVAVHTDMATPPIHLLGTEEQKQRYLVPGDQGREDRLPRDHRARRRLRRRRDQDDARVRDGDEYVINGSKTFITNGARADFIVLVTKTDPDAGHDGFTLFIVDIGRRRQHVPGFTSAEAREDGDARLRHGACSPSRTSACRPRTMLGQEGKGFYHIMLGAPGRAAGRRRRLRGGRRARASSSTLEYAKEREAFGRPIGRFQAIRHKFAEMATKIEAAKQMVYATAWRFQNGEYPVREITEAKLYASRDRRARSPTSASRSTAATAT